MKMPDVLMLAWEIPSPIQVGTTSACFIMAEALANRADVALILPQAYPDLSPGKAAVLGLNNINLLEPVAKPQPEHLPFANESYIRSQIPLYGTPFPNLNEAYTRQQHHGENITTGQFANDGTMLQETEQPNFFAPQQFDTLSLPAQVIEYARYASRLASKVSFEFIYTFDWRTLLAGTEIKIWSNKRLGLFVDSLSSEGCLPDSKGWIYEIEKQAFAKADVLFASNDQIASKLNKDYGMSWEKININREDKLEGFPKYFFSCN